MWDWLGTGRGKATLAGAYVGSFVASGLIFGWGGRGMILGPLAVTIGLMLLTAFDLVRTIRNPPQDGAEPPQRPTPPEDRVVDRISMVRRGYDKAEVDAVFARAVTALESDDPMVREEMAQTLAGIAFPVRKRGYSPSEVDELLTRVRDKLSA